MPISSEEWENKTDAERNSLLAKDLGEYIIDNYGSCAIATECKCLRTGWLGRKCPNWKPVKSRNWEDLRKELGG